MQGCKEKPRHEAIYQRVRPLLDSIPEEALSILDSIPKKDLQSGLDSARYILLHAIAENKAYKFTTKDSTITLAIETFRTYNQIDDLRNSLFIQGWIRILDQQFVAAIRPLLEAEELIDNRTPELEKGLIYHALADCCNFTSNGLMAIEYSRNAYSAYVNANKPIHALYNISDRAAYFNNMGDYRNAHKLLLSMLDSAKNTFNDDLIGWYYDGLGRSCIGLQNYDEALKYFQNLKEVKDTLDDMTEGLLVYAMTKAGNKSTADSIARQLVAADNLWAIKGITPITSSEDMLVDISARQENQMADVLNSTYANEYSSIIKENYTLRRNLMVTELKAKRLLNILLAILILITLLIASIGIYKFRQYAILQKKLQKKRERKHNVYKPSQKRKKKMRNNNLK